MPTETRPPRPNSIPLDLTPERLALHFGNRAGAAILEGGAEFGEAGRWSIFAAEPTLVFEATEGVWSVRKPGVEVPVDSGTTDPLSALGRLVARLGLARTDDAPNPDEPPFTGGLIGFLGYDLALEIEAIPRKAPRDSRIPDCRFALHDACVTFDHRTKEAILWFSADSWSRFSTAEARDDFLTRLHASPSDDVLNPRRSRFSAFLQLQTRDQYIASVEKALDYIAAGDVFQVNLSQRFDAYGTAYPLDLYTRLRDRSPAPFSALLAWDGLAIVSASPEWFYTTRGDRIVTRPIKGTRPRGATPEEDDRLAKELVASPKDRAELTMIVDLERNDLGRVCRYGTVKVIDPLTIESYAQVHHLVATVEGRLRPEIGAIDVVRAVFPGGSITGAPKVRAMEIIDELEPSRRGLYTGAIGFYGRHASSFNISIRTLTIESDRVSYQVGGGIVADSVPELEYEETLHKGRALREVLQESRGVSPRIWHRGRILEENALAIDVRDRTFEHGLGLFETFRTWNGNPSLLSRHLARLRHSAQTLGLVLDPQTLPDASAVRKLRDAEEWPDDCLLRITTSGGVENSPVEVWMRSRPLPPKIPVSGVRLVLSTIDPGFSPLFAHKTLNYWAKRIAHEQAASRDAFDCVIVDQTGRLLETSIANLFLVIDGTLTTPRLDGQILPGIMRGFLIEVARTRGISFEESDLRLSDLDRAREVFLSNSVRCIIPVAGIETRAYNVPGPITRLLQRETLHRLCSGGSET